MKTNADLAISVCSSCDFLGAFKQNENSRGGTIFRCRTTLKFRLALAASCHLPRPAAVSRFTESGWQACRAGRAGICLLWCEIVIVERFEAVNH